ncbi:unnamed protein product [Blepharisma stoltei]|uniref:Sperm-tail PG-rich repeat-containing protein 2 n=1 Tax=Blepharisma stoltei TaxID=1481888 RepID=A0AAU9IXD0_9CILI|nr:unnamed protein product [Blepharisma stoltei]
MKFSASSKNIKDPNFDIPGPGQYNQSLAYIKVPSYKFGTSKRDPSPENLNKNPGPGTYETGSVTERSTVRFGTESREKLRLDNSPGPGAYDIPVSLDKKAALLMGRTLPKQLDHVPGPGAYDINRKWYVRSVSVGKEMRFKRPDPEIPGPGAYTMNERASTTATIIGTSKRRPFIEHQDVPGPGDYNIPLKFTDKVGFSLMSRIPRKERDLTPGPGAYNIPDTREIRAPTLTAKREEIWKKSDTPGPGNYLITSLKSHGPAYTLGHKSTEKLNTDAPGPGNYDTVVTEKSHAMVIGKSKRFELTNEEKHMRIVPGPGAYDPKIEFVGLSKKLRRDSRKSENHLPQLGQVPQVR